MSVAIGASVITPASVVLTAAQPASAGLCLSGPGCNGILGLLAISGILPDVQHLSFSGTIVGIDRHTNAVVTGTVSLEATGTTSGGTFSGLGFLVLPGGDGVNDEIVTVTANAATITLTPEAGFGSSSATLLRTPTTPTLPNFAALGVMTA